MSKLTPAFSGVPESDNRAMTSTGLNQSSPETMPAFARILVATDFSPASRAAFHTALDLCTMFGSTLTILHVFEYVEATPMPGVGSIVDLQNLDQDARNWLHALKREAAQSGVQAVTLLRAGSPAATIQEAILSEHIDLAVLGTSALHGFERLVFGSTAEAVLRKAPIPVITVGPRARSAVLPEQARPVVFATDFHATTVNAIRFGAVLSQATDSPLHCLLVLPRSLEGGTLSSAIPTILNEALQQVAVSSGLAVDHPVAATTFGSEVSNAVVDYAKQHHAKLIVLGIRQATLASTHTPAHIAYRIITEASCPVLTMAFESHHRSHSLAAACL